LLTSAFIATPAGAWSDAAGGQDPAEAMACPVVASAQGLRITVTKPGDLVLNEPAGSDSPTAQTCVNVALSTSTAFASVDNPGATVMSLPGTVGTTAGTAVPDFPGYVASSYPSQPKSDDAEQGAVGLHVRSTETSSTAEAEVGSPTAVGQGQATASATATVEPASAHAAATAASVTAPFTINGLLTVGEVRSSARATISGQGPVQRTSSLEIGRTTMAGQEVVITSHGVRAVGQVVPLPPSDDTTSQLRRAGIEVTYLSAQPTAHGVLSPGVRIRAEREDPSGAVTVVDYVLGRAFAGVSPVMSQLDASSSHPARPDPVTGIGSSDRAARAGASLDAATSPSTAPGPRVADEGQQAASSDRSLSLTGARLSPGLGALYLALILGGLVILASSTSIRLMGVRTRWIS
jgi:hypothetical protein